MAVQAYNSLLRFALAVALALGAVLAPASALAAHGPVAAEASRHIELGEQDKDASHVHDDGKPDERRSGHLHGDGASDHSHEKLGVLASTVPVLASRGESFLANVISTFHVYNRRRLDRPPRTTATH